MSDKEQVTVSHGRKYGAHGERAPGKNSDALIKLAHYQRSVRAVARALRRVRPAVDADHPLRLNIC